MTIDNSREGLPTVKRGHPLYADGNTFLRECSKAGACAPRRAYEDKKKDPAQ